MLGDQMVLNNLTLLPFHLRRQLRRATTAAVIIKARTVHNLDHFFFKYLKSEEQKLRMGFADIASLKPSFFKVVKLGTSYLNLLMVLISKKIIFRYFNLFSPISKKSLHS